MEENIDGVSKSQASIPANYVSILQLQQQWLKEKERRQKEREKEEEEEQRRKQQQLEEERRREEEDREKEEAEKQLKEAGAGVERRKLDKKGVVRNKRPLASRRRRKKGSYDGGEASRGEARKSEVMAITCENGEEAVPEAEKLGKVTKKNKKLGNRRKNRARVKEDVIEGESNAPPSNNQTERIPVENEIRRVYRPKPANATAEKDAPHREHVAMAPTAEIKKKVESLKISGEERRRDARADRHNQRPLRRMGSKGPMNAKLVWVKKEQIDGDTGGSSAVSL